MNRVFLVLVVSALLVTFGFAQTPDAGSNTDPANVKGCLGGSDGNYTVVEDGTRQIFKITTSSVDLKPHLGHDVKLIGHRASATVSTGAADNSFAVTELSMISEHCAAAAALAATVIPPSETVIAPDPAPVAASTTASAPTAAPVAPTATASAPAVDTAAPAAPAAPVAPSAAVVSTPAVEAAAPATIVAPPAAAVTVAPSPSPATPTPAVEVAAPAANDNHPTRQSAHARKLAATKAAAATAPEATVNPSPEPASVPAADTATPAATATPVSPSAEAVSAPDATAPAAAAPAPTATHRTGSLALLIGFVVVVIVLGTTAPLIGRWRKRKMLERDGSPNLSFTHDTNTAEVTTNEASSGRDKPEPRQVA